LGTGMNPEIGEMAAKKEIDKIKDILKGQDLVILVACLGGGMGSGAAPVFAKISKDLGNLTYGIFTLPFKFEGQKKLDIAKSALRKLKKRLNAVTIIPNERIFQIIDRTSPLKKALSAINKILTDGLQSLIEIIYRPGLINIDFADLKTVFEGRGSLTYLNSVEIEKKDYQKLIEKIVNSPLYPYNIKGAKRVLFNISAQKDLSLDQVSQISRAISNLVNKEAKIIFGVSKNPKEPKIKVNMLATGCAQKIFFKKEKKPYPSLSKKKKKKKIKRTKKIKIKISPKLKKEEKTIPKTPSIPPSSIPSKKEKIRKNALEVKKEIEKEEAKILAKEKFWEAPAFLRKKLNKG